MPNYQRGLSEKALTTLLPGGPHRFLIDVPHFVDHGDPFAFDIQLRHNDRVQIYHGTTSVLCVDYREGTWIASAPAYAGTLNEFELGGPWQPGNEGQMAERLGFYLQAIVGVVNAQYYANKAEGWWQNRIAIAMSKQWRPGMDWLVIDREAVVGFRNDGERQQFCGPIQEAYRAIAGACQQTEPALWETNPPTLGNECDLLALGPDGELLCIELKAGGNIAGIYFGTLQCKCYAGIYSPTIQYIQDDILQFARQKVDLGLLPAEATARIPSQIRSVQSILAVGAPNDRSNCWAMLGALFARHPESRASVIQLRNPLDFGLTLMSL